MRAARALPAALAAATLSAYATAATASCVAGVTSIDFGTVNVVPGTAIDTTATVTLSCGTSGAERSCLSYSAGNQEDGTSRRMSSGSNRLRYQLYSNSGRTTVWGSYATGYGSGVTVDTTSSTTATVYARILGGQSTVAPGSYSDSVAFQLTSQDSPYGACPLASPGVTQSQAVTVQVIVTANCQVSATNLNFGSKGSLSTAVTAASFVTVRCSNGTPYTIGLGGGSEGDTSARKMASGADKIAYQLYSDNFRTVNWGNVSGDSVTGTGTGSDQDFFVYGRVPVQTTPPAGVYSDTIVVTVTY